MADPKKNTLNRQASLSHIEQSLKIIPTPPQEAPVTIYPGPKARHANLSKADLEIADRLEKLKKRDVEPPTEDEMASRLAQLKGLPADHYTKPQSTFYKPPDNRSNVEKSDDLFKQMMEEVTLDARLPKPEDEIEARLARLRGHVEGQPSRLRGEVEGQLQHPVGTSALGSPQAPTEAPFDYNEVEKLMKQAELETTGARAAMKDLAVEPEISAHLAEAARKRKMHRPRGRASGSTSSDEKISGSDEDERRAKGSQKVATAKDAAEVERIVQLYTKKAQEKKKRRKARAKKAVKDPSAAGGGSSSSNESCTSSNLSTSESERLSDSD